MKKYKIFPKGYDPMVASGPVTPDIIAMGISWTPEDTERAKELEKQATISDTPVTSLWYEELKE
jgi:hypothetical protein